MIPFEITDWEKLPGTEYKGENGTAIWRTKLYKGFRLRLVDYSPNYKADHWCSKGHVVFCVEGEFISHLKDGSEYLIKKGMSYQTSDDLLNPHLSVSSEGCRIFIVDGDFLNQ
jgi:hypothetical protein